MTCFRDRTYCPYYHECQHGYFGTRALTKDVRINAERVNLPICQFTEKPECFKETQ